MKKRIFLLAALAAGLVLCLTACGETNGDPVTVTLWHVYGGEVNSPMNALVEEFNRTVGQEQGIRVRVDSVSNSGVIHESVLAAAYKDPGAPELPDLFVSTKSWRATSLNLLRKERSMTGWSFCRWQNPRRSSL